VTTEPATVWLTSQPFTASAEQMVSFAIAVGDSLPNIHTDRATAQRAGLADVVVDGRMLALVVSRQLRQCLSDTSAPVAVSGLHMRFKQPVHPGHAIRTRLRVTGLDGSGTDASEFEVAAEDGTVVVKGHAVIEVARGDSNARTEA
jgi:acyl dehydratase